MSESKELSNTKNAIYCLNLISQVLEKSHEPYAKVTVCLHFINHLKNQQQEFLNNLTKQKENCEEKETKKIQKKKKGKKNNATDEQ